MRPLVSSGWLLAALLISPVLASAANQPAPPALVPIEDFAQTPIVSGMRMSPDGKAVAYTASADQKTAIVIKDLDTGKVSGVDDGWAPTWVNDGRIAFGGNGFAAIDRDGSNYKGLAGRARQMETHQVDGLLVAPSPIFSEFTTKANKDDVLLLQYDYPNWRGRYSIILSFPHVLRMDTRSGGFMRMVENPGDVMGWGLDASGVVRVGVEYNKGLYRVLYRDDAKQGWRVLKGLDWERRGTSVRGMSADGKQLYLGRISDNGKWALYTYDIADEKMGEMLLGHAKYDIGSFDGDGSELMLARQTRELLGVRYVAEIPKTQWFDQQMASIQAALDKSLPERINTITDMDVARQRFLVNSSSARDPGTYYVFDLGKQQLTPVMATMPWIKPDQMAEMIPITYKSRDGLPIHGFLTLPAGRGTKKLPLVVMPHGGPFVRETYRFNPDVQFLANRGYAVLQMNFRGSPGFGQAFLDAGKHQVGTGMIDDITDGAKWAIAKGIADPDRVAIMGWSYGGYAALMGVIREPKLFRCAIDLAGVTDWKAILKYDNEVSPNSLPYTRDYIGDFQKDAAALDDISPVYHADAIQVPLLLVYSKSDDTVHYDQATAITKALDKAGKPYEFMAKFNEGHGFYEKKHRVALYQTIEAFLAKNMGPAAAGAATGAN
ncbi:S9 family peptidase [Horticoccus luteus]|uniref:S9 family peptidase n=1 Tax=Horticoccus luteus TaxID=2862869 RepID=A0A8F9TTS7_9BACT|nr:S9 family peptidase [Horticoccus luteus]QYM79124.1 S9 family peptidase [Horticoccus luteus]